MVRAALSTPKRFRRGAKPFAHLLPAASVVAASFLAALPIVSTSGWYPDFGYLVLLGWRLLRADPWPAWWAAPLGLVNDLFTGYPLGFSVALWAATMLVLDLVDRRTMWRDYWIEWMVAAVLIALDEWLLWRVTRMAGADLPFTMMLPQLLISICLFPLTAWAASRLDRWRLGR